MHGNAPAEIPLDGKRLVYNSKQARALLGDMPESTFRRLTASGQLRAKTTGGKVFVKHEDLQAYIDALDDVCPVGAAATA